MNVCLIVSISKATLGGPVHMSTSRARQAFFCGGSSLVLSSCGALLNKTLMDYVVFIYEQALDLLNIIIGMAI